MNEALFWWELAGTFLAFVTMGGNMFLALHGNPEVRDAINLAKATVAKQDQRFEQVTSILEGAIKQGPSA